MNSPRKMLAILAGLFVFAASAHAVRAEDMDNSRYKAWAGFKVGSTVTHSGTMSAGQMQITTEMKTTLKEVKDDELTLEVVTTTTMMGQAHEGKPTTQVVKAKVEKRDIKEEGEEDVSAMGKTFKCKVLTAANDAPAANPRVTMDADAKFWTNKDVPGGMVKLEAKGKRQGSDQELTMTYILKDFEAK